MNGRSTDSLQPTWFGQVTTTDSALILFEACLRGTLHLIPRRPKSVEQGQLIKSGCVFIYNENTTGIRRWTDRVPWSPSRIQGHFLVYRELTKPFPPGMKKRATKRKRPLRLGYPNLETGRSDAHNSPTTPRNIVESHETMHALVGSLVDSYGFKEGGLVKKTMSVELLDVRYHLVTYYRIEDVLDGTLQQPLADGRLANIEPRQTLIRQKFQETLDNYMELFPEQMNSLQQEPYLYGSDGRLIEKIPEEPSWGQHPELVYVGYLPDGYLYQAYPSYHISLDVSEFYYDLAQNFNYQQLFDLHIIPQTMLPKSIQLLDKTGEWNRAPKNHDAPAPPEPISPAYNINDRAEVLSKDLNLSLLGSRCYSGDGG